MIALRILGILLVLAALAFAGLDVATYLGRGSWRPAAVGDVWFWIDPPSLGLLEAGIVRHVSENLWYDAVFPILQLPAWALLGGLGLILLAFSFAFARRRRRLFRKA